MDCKLMFVLFLIYRKGHLQEIQLAKLPDIWYCYCNSTDCLPSKDCHGKKNPQVLVLGCRASYPIRWLAQKPFGSIWNATIDGINLYQGNAEGIYTQELSIPIKSRGFSNYLRCQSFQSPGQTAGIYLNNRISFPKNSVPTGKQVEGERAWNIFYVDSRENAFIRETEIQLTVPCMSKTMPRHLFTSPNISADAYDFIELRQSERLIEVKGHGGNNEHIFNNTYDPRVGFRIKTSGISILKSNFECISKQPQYKVVMTPVNLRDKIGAKLSQRRRGTVQCFPSIVNMEVSIKFGACNSISECDLKWKPWDPHIFSVVKKPGNAFGVVSLENEEIYSTSRNGIKLDYPHGFLHCCGLRPKYDSQNESSELEYVSEMKYMFTGLDGKAYFTSDETQRRNDERIIALEEVSYSEDGMIRTYECKISTFLLLPNIQFLVHFDDPIFDRESTILRPGHDPVPLEASIQQVQWKKQEAIASWLLVLPIQSNMTGITCTAPHINDNMIADVDMKISEKIITNSKWEANTAFYVASFAIFMFAILLALLVLLWTKYKTAVNKIRNLAGHEVDEFLLGNKNAQRDQHGIPLDRMPFEDNKIIRSEHLKIEETILGEGQYGIVQKGTLNGQSVAVKSSKSTADIEYFKAFLKEIKLMAYIGEHENVVRFCGAVVDKIQERLCFAVIELSPYGNLNNYLRTHCNKYSDESMELLETIHTSNTGNPGIQLNKTILISFCRQIATGMEFLSQKKVIHSDLAARNVLVWDKDVVKITDFGLSRQLYNCANYTKTSQTPLPWRSLFWGQLDYGLRESTRIRISSYEAPKLHSGHI
ncbi:unnamed protein product [Allacma fusca]|uniref:Protein kinase domain-containing protein n=1 Tax=Allacma fusca TaxID=39272 RepID=A0A8J2KKC9_9HEXA|nr:unnamed protein product [Allacma fusca]